MTCEGIDLDLFTNIVDLVMTVINKKLVNRRCETVSEGDGNCLAYMNLIVNCPNVQICTIGAPANGCYWTPDLESHYSSFLRIASLVCFPNFYQPIISSGCNQLNASATCKCSVNCIDYFTVRTYSSNSLTGSKVCYA